VAEKVTGANGAWELVAEGDKEIEPVLLKEMDDVEENAGTCKY